MATTAPVARPRRDFEGRRAASRRPLAALLLLHDLLHGIELPLLGFLGPLRIALTRGSAPRPAAEQPDGQPQEHAPAPDEIRIAHHGAPRKDVSTRRTKAGRPDKRCLG